MRTITTAAALLLTACGYTPPPVPVGGPAPDVARLVGEWEGEYSSRESGRSGYIAFSLGEERDTASGDVLMMPPGQPGPRWNGSRGGIEPVADLPASAQLLTIHFVRAEDGLVSGSLDPYRDPGCGCMLDTAFIGRVEGDSISGTYRSRHIPSGEVDHGTWVVRRKVR